MPPNNPQGNAGGVDQILQALKSIAVAENGVADAFSAAFPNGTTTSATATAGSASLPAAPSAFLILNVGGTAYKVPLYNP